jgi:beta-lactamase regulating signal transducer with metallopeptidase domain
LVYRLFLKKETFVEFNRHFLNIGLIFSLIAPFLKHKVSSNEKIFSNISIPENLNAAIDISMGAETYKLHLLENLHYLYIAISIVFIIRLIVNIISFYRYIKPLEKHKIDDFVFIESEDADSPFSFMNNIVYNPKLFSTSELGDILNHEKEHSRQKHSYDIILIEIYRAINWLNPVAWLFKKAIVQNLEFLADTKAIQKANSRVNYQSTMLKLSIPSSQYQLTNNFYDSLIKKRISLINTNKSKNINLMKSLLVVPAIIVFVFQFNTEIIAQNNQESPRITIEKIEGSVAETIDNLIESTPGYGKNSSPLYVIDGILVNRLAIFSIPNDGVSAISILKKDYVEERYGKGAVESGVINIQTNRDKRVTYQGVKIPESEIKKIQRPIIMVNGKLFEGDATKINPDDIKTVNVIKDSDIAKKKYGENGKNGVVEITLKDGVKLN